MMNLLISIILISATNMFQNIIGLHEDDFCINSNNENGICKKSEDCSKLKEMLASGPKPKICGWTKDDINPIICCPTNDVKPKTSNTEIDRSELVKLVRQKCVEYGKYVKEKVPDPAFGLSGEFTELDFCGRLAEPMILGGVEAKPREFPHMALVGYDAAANNQPEYLCGGSLISEQFVLSAAHCSHPTYARGSARWVKLGELDTSTDFDEANPVVYEIIEIINHPGYDSSRHYNDIALFKLDKIVEFGAFIRPICLDTKEVTPPGFLTASGWGHTSWAGSGSSILMKVQLKHVGTSVCNRSYTETAELDRGIIGESMVCAGNEEEKDTCQNDSGGPLQVNITEPYCMYDLVGITCFGKGCGLGYPGVYTRVSYFIPWIVQHVWPDSI